MQRREAVLQPWGHKSLAPPCFYLLHWSTGNWKRDILSLLCFLSLQFGRVAPEMLYTFRWEQKCCMCFWNAAFTIPIQSEIWKALVWHFWQIHRHGKLRWCQYLWLLLLKQLPWIKKASSKKRRSVAYALNLRKNPKTVQMSSELKWNKNEK